MPALCLIAVMSIRFRTLNRVSLIPYDSSARRFLPSR